MAHIVAFIEHLVMKYIETKYSDDDALRGLTARELDQELRNEDNDGHYDLKDEIFRVMMNELDMYRIVDKAQENLPDVDEEDGHRSDDST